MLVNHTSYSYVKGFPYSYNTTRRDAKTFCPYLEAKGTVSYFQCWTWTFHFLVPWSLRVSINRLTTFPNYHSQPKHFYYNVSLRVLWSSLRSIEQNIWVSSSCPKTTKGFSSIFASILTVSRKSAFNGLGSIRPNVSHSTPVSWYMLGFIFHSRSIGYGCGFVSWGFRRGLATFRSFQRWSLAECKQVTHHIKKGLTSIVCVVTM